MKTITKAVLLGGVLVTALACGLTEPKYINYTEEDGDADVGDADDAGDDGTTDGTSTAVTYESDIKALLTAKCAMSGCHAAGGANVDLSTFDAAKAAGAASLEEINANRMPLGSSLPAAEKALFQQWVTAGFPQ